MAVTLEKSNIEIDYGRLGSNVENLVSNINIPYDYLPYKYQGKIGSLITQYILPNMQELSRSGKPRNILNDLITTEAANLAPEKTSLSHFLIETKLSYKNKIASQIKIRKLIIDLQSNQINDDLLNSAVNTLVANEPIEAKYFATNSLTKKYIERVLQEINYLENDDNFGLFVTSAIPSTYITYELDVREYLASDENSKDTLKQTLLNKYFNLNSEYLETEIAKIHKRTFSQYDTKEKRIDILKNISEIREDLKSRLINKINLLSERRIKTVENLDELIMLDNVFDKYFEKKMCFIHDVFLKIGLLDYLHNRKVLDLNDENINEKFKEALFTDLKDIKKQLISND